MEPAGYRLAKPIGVVVRYIDYARPSLAKSQELRNLLQQHVVRALTASMELTDVASANRPLIPRRGLMGVDGSLLPSWVQAESGGGTALPGEPDASILDKRVPACSSWFERRRGCRGDDHG